MPNLKTTPEERAALRDCMQPGTLDNALGLAPKAALMLLDDLDTLAAEVGRLRLRLEALADVVSSAAPLTWTAGAPDIEAAAAWDKEAFDELRRARAALESQP